MGRRRGPSAASTVEALDLFLADLPPEVAALPRAYQLWVLAYCGPSRWDAADAAKRAGLGGDKPAGQEIAGRLASRRADVKAAVEAWTASEAITAGEWLAQMRREALYDPDPSIRLRAMESLGKHLGLLGGESKRKKRGNKPPLLLDKQSLIRHHLGKEHDLDEASTGDKEGEVTPPMAE